MGGIEVPIHQQDYGDTCGCACQQMVLHSLGMPLDKCGQITLRDMNKVYREAAYAGWGTGTDPVSFQKTLNDAGSIWVTARGIRFVARLLGSESEISQEIADSISNYGIASCALVGDGSHWVVVTGFDVEESPKPAASSGTASAGIPLISGVWRQLKRIAEVIFRRKSSTVYNISGFHVNDPDPAQYYRGSTNLEHCDSEDDCSKLGPVDRCGTGDEVLVHKPPDLNRIVEVAADWTLEHYPLIYGIIHHGTGPQIITLDDWKDRLMTASLPTKPPSPDTGKFVAVRADSASTSTSIAGVSPSRRYNYPKGPVVMETNMALTPQQIKDAAFAGLIKHRLGERSPVWQQVINERTAAAPELVHRIDRQDRDYYLVPLLVGNKSPAMARVDVSSGTFLSGIAVSRIIDSDGYGYVVPPIGATRYRLLEDQMRIELPGDSTPGGILIDANNYQGLFWQSCLESFSPYNPFFKLELNGREVFVPLDVFRSQPPEDKLITRYYDKLTTGVHGM
jgi:hypothetical protein